MTIATAADLSLFIDAWFNSPEPENCNQCLVEITKVLGTRGVAAIVQSSIVTMLEAGPSTALMSIWACGLMMGRAFESSRQDSAELERMMKG